MARLPYLEADQVAPEYRDMLKRNTNLHKLLVNLRHFGERYVPRIEAVLDGYGW